MPVKEYKTKRGRIRSRLRAKVKGMPKRPRLSVFRSNKYIYAQITDDTQGKTLLAANELTLKGASFSKTEGARAVGKLLAQKALEKKITRVVFDRRSYKFHGRVKALAEMARKGGLEF